MRRRAFTLIEVTLAAVLASLVIMATLSVFTMVDRGERSTSRLYEQSIELSMLHRALERSLYGIVTSPTTSAPPPRTDEDQAQVVADRPGNKPVWRDPDQRPRIYCEIDEGQRFSGRVREGRFTSHEDTSGPMLPQRLELVLTEPPLPGLARSPSEADQAEDTGERYRFGYITRGDRSRREPETRIRADEPPMRCALELWPDSVRDAQERDEPVTIETYLAGPVEGWTLWYRPADRDGVPTDSRDAPSIEGGAYPLLSGITFCRWKFFHDGVRDDVFGATFSSDLPAYVELELETRLGAYVNWMFEVSWISDLEPSDPAFDDQSGEEDGDDEPDDPTAGVSDAQDEAPADPAGGTRDREGEGDE